MNIEKIEKQMELIRNNLKRINNNEVNDNIFKIIYILNEKIINIHANFKEADDFTKELDKEIDNYYLSVIRYYINTLFNK